MEGLNWQTIQVPLAAGLNQRQDDRARQPPYLDICKDVQFDELGGLQTCKPFGAFGAGFFDVLGRKVFGNGAERLVFTKDSLYSYNAEADTWVNKGTHLAVKVAESSTLITTGDQINPDRAELDNTIIYAWEDTGSVYVAAKNKQTGAIIMPATSIVGAVRPRLVTLATKVLLFFCDNLNFLLCYALDPANPAGALAGASTTVVGAGVANLYYDAVKIPGADSAFVGCRRQVTTSYSVATVTAALAVTATVKARTCDGPIAVSCSPTGTHVQIARGNTTNVQGDLLLVSTHADVFTAQAIGTASGTPINQIAAAHRSVQDGGQYRCYVTWSAVEVVTSTAFQCKQNWVDTNNALGAQAVFALRLGVASRSFDHDGRVYTWLAFAAQSAAAGMGEPLGMRAQLQNTYFLYRDDGFMAAKAVFGVGGGHSASTGRLPGVALVETATPLGAVGWDEKTYAWCGTERRLIDLGGGGNRSRTGYGDRGPRDILFTFDSNEARRCVRFGATFYIAGGGEVLQYDGEGLAEVGFTIYPWVFATAVVGGGAIPAGKYSYKSTLRWQNSAGEVERSTTATGEQSTVAGAQKVAMGAIANLHVTKKRAPRSNPAVEVWRTVVNPEDDNPFFLVTDNDPATLAGDNRYLANDPLTGFQSPTFNDNLLDDALIKRPSSPENGGVLENLCPPAATIIAASSERLFLAGIAGDPNRIWYSKQRAEGEIAAFHDQLTVQLPADGGPITALEFVDETLFAFKRRAIYALPGQGFDNGSGGSNYGPARVIATDVGAVSAEAVARTPNGHVFKSEKGWYVLRGSSVEYIGASICDHDSEPVVGVHALESRHEIRVLTNARMLVFDTVAQQWGERTLVGGNGAVSAALCDGTYVYLDIANAYSERSEYTGLTYGIDVETSWIKVNDLLGGGRVRQIQVLGEWRSDCRVRVRIAYDYKATYVDDRTWSPPATLVPGDELYCGIGPSRQQCRAIKVRITALHEDPESADFPDGEALKLTCIAFEIGQRPGLNKRLAAAQKVG